MARSHAVVMGSGIAGLTAARVLADWFEHVTLVERDEFPRRGEQRPGVPQGAQWHMLMPSAAAMLEELHPGLLAELESAGVPALHFLRETHMEVAGHLLNRDGALPMAWHQPSRVMLEAHLRTWTSARVLMRPGVSALDLIVTDEGRVAGVLLDTPDGLERLAADLVIDATGGALRPTAELPTPEELRVDVDVRQVTVTVAVRTVPSAVEPLLLHGPHVARPWGAAATRIEGNRWQLTAIGYRGHHPPTDRDGLLDFVEPLIPPHWWRMFAAAEWPAIAVSDFPTSIWRRWDTVSDPPAGLLVMGDGLLRLNPVHGNGMALAIRQAMLLRDCLEHGDGDLPRRFYKAAGEMLSKEWALSEGPDRLCADPPDEPEALAKMDKLLHKILVLAESDPEIVQNLLRVQWGLASPATILSPATIRKLVGGRFRLGLGRGRTVPAQERVSN